MSIKTMFLLSAFFSVASLPQLAVADHYYEGREGLYLSGGLGIHSTGLDGVVDGIIVAQESNSGLMTSFKVGGYINPYIAVYYQHESAGWSYMDVNNTRVASSMSGLGGTFYFHPDAGAYVEFGLGIGALSVESYVGQESHYGSAALIGLGTELSDNLQLGVTLTSTSILDNQLYNVSYDTSTLAVKLELKL